MKLEELKAIEFIEETKTIYSTQLPKEEVRKVFQVTLELVKKDDFFADFTDEEITDSEEFYDYFMDNIYNSIYSGKFDRELWEEETVYSEIKDIEEDD